MTPPILFLKYGHVRGVVKLSRNEEEPKKLKTMEYLLGDLDSHVVKVLHADKTIFAMSYPRPYLNFPVIRTLKDLFIPRICRGFCSEQLLKSILFQCISCLQRLHSHGLEFTHNDMKAENILLECCEAPILLFDTGRIYSQGVRVVFIDAETVTGTVFPCSLIKSLSLAKQRSFGLDYLTWSAFTDIHLVFFETLFACRTSNPYWGSKFAAFLETGGIPLKYFKAPFITTENRLSAVGKISLKLETQSLDHMLQSSYFNEIRTQGF
jgi:serine/threonine protein kinase